MTKDKKIWTKTNNLRFEKCPETGERKLFQEHVRLFGDPKAYPAPDDRYNLGGVEWLEFINQEPPEYHSEIYVDGKYGYVEQLEIGQKLSDPPIPYFSIVMDYYDPPTEHFWIEVLDVEQSDPDA